MSDAALRDCERAVTAAPHDAAAWERLDAELSRHARPTHRAAQLTAFASAIHEVGLARDPWKMILTPCCGEAPRWAPFSVRYDFYMRTAAYCSTRNSESSRRCGRRFLDVAFGPTMPPYHGGYCTQCGVSQHEWLATGHNNECTYRDDQPPGAYETVRGVAWGHRLQVRADGDLTPRSHGRADHVEAVRTILRVLPSYFALERVMAIRV